MHTIDLVICPKCGAIAEVRPKYLGGHGWHHAAFCTADRDHQTPVVWDNGRYHAAEYRRDGLQYSIIRTDHAEQQRAAATCHDVSTYLARILGGEPWEYEPDWPPLVDLSEVPTPELAMLEAEYERVRNDNAPSRLWYAGQLLGEIVKMKAGQS